MSGSDDTLIGDRDAACGRSCSTSSATPSSSPSAAASACAPAPSRSAAGARARRSPVEDTGIGIDEEQRKRLFQPFAQADSSTTRRFGGTGLGLSIVRRLAQLMDGDIAAESAPGSGLDLHVRLIFDVAARSALFAAQGISPGGPVRRVVPETTSNDDRPVVLVVDDHPVNQEVLVRQLDLLGIAADTAADGVEGLEAWQNNAYAAVLADIHMPRMDGYEMTRRLRAIEAERRDGARTPVVAVTANAMKGEEERCLAAGMDAYLVKPVNIDLLRATLVRWLPIDNRARRRRRP